MRHLVMTVCLTLSWTTTACLSGQNISEDSLRHELSVHATRLRPSGEAVLLKEAEQHQYFLLGELHGEVEIPELLSDLWPALWRAGYRHVAAEVSPWAATHLQRAATDDPTLVPGLWTREQAANIARFAAPGQSVLWGCDIEEAQPGSLISQMAEINFQDDRLRAMKQLIDSGYRRNQATALLRIAESDHPAHDVVVGGESLWKSTLDTLQVEALRSDPQTKYSASYARERVMKELFLSHVRQEPQAKVLLRFGRNHLHRGLDARGISTLGNFVSEWALAQGTSAFNVGVFAAGGEEHLAGKTFSADERQDELTFALLAELAAKEVTLFDLRELRPILHAIPFERRSPLEANLTYWADSYDFLLCYPKVSPLVDAGADSQ